tara:strand:+ start:2495 stop:3370 length:876 start_codon:yes stop_codon:yes gene_type:complete
MWHCPLCKSPISLDTQQIMCPNRHSFDKAKSGYVNLLPVQFKKSKLPGDDKDMVRARREFHKLNAYLPLKERMISLLGDALSKKDIHSEPLDEGHKSNLINIYDAGCGEGSYLDAIIDGLLSKGLAVNGAGSDIAKIAVELAAKAFKRSQFVVASSFDLPLGDDSQDVIIQVFAPGSNDEYLRALRDHGLLLTVDPAPNHLFELKTMIYDDPKQHQLEDAPRVGFTRLHNEIFTFSIDFKSHDHVLALIKMTPFYWKLPEGKIKEIVKTLTSVSADFHIQLWQKHNSEDVQ